MNAFRTTLMALSLVGTALAAQAVCDRSPEVTFASDSTPEGVIALVSWDSCDGSHWEVCSKGTRAIDNGNGGIQILPACDTYDSSSFSVRQGEPNRYVIRWLDGAHAGERHIVTIVWP